MSSVSFLEGPGSVDRETGTVAKDEERLCIQADAGTLCSLALALWSARLLDARASIAVLRPCSQPNINPCNQRPIAP